MHESASVADRFTGRRRNFLARSGVGYLKKEYPSARKDYSVGQARSLPAMGPFAFLEVKASLSLRVMERVVHGEGAGRLIQLHHEKASPFTSHHHPLRLGVPSGPVWLVGIAELQT